LSWELISIFSPPVGYFSWKNGKHASIKVFGGCCGNHLITVYDQDGCVLKITMVDSMTEIMQGHYIFRLSFPCIPKPQSISLSNHSHLTSAILDYSWIKPVKEMVLNCWLCVCFSFDERNIISANLDFLNSLCFMLRISE